MIKRKSPIFKFISIHRKNSPVSSNKYLRLLAFYSKILPTGFLGNLENLFYKRKLRRYSPKHPPVYILGHWRSGTSFLQSLLGAAPQFVYHTKFQTFFPESFLITEKTIKQPATAILQSVGLIDSWDNGIAHNFSSLDTSSEIEISMMNQAKPYSFHWGQVFPKSWRYYFDKYLFWDGMNQNEILRWKKNVHHLNKKVNFLNPECRLLVKNPGDTARVKQILDIYPDAKFVYVHRNPYDVFYSSIKLWKKILANLSLQEIGLDEIKDAIIHIYKRVHEKYFLYKDLIPKGNLVEIAYDDLKNDPLKTIQNVFKELNLQNFEDAKSMMKQYLNENAHSPSEYTYYSEDIERINNEWHFVFDHLNYSMYTPQKNRKVV